MPSGHRRTGVRLSEPRTKAAVLTQSRPDRQALGYQEDARFTNASEFVYVQQTLRDCRAEEQAKRPTTPECSAFTSGHFRVVARLDTGAWVMYEGYEPALERKVAIKVLPPELGAAGYFVRRFRAEATVPRLTHPNVVTILSEKTKTTISPCSTSKANPGRDAAC